MQLFAAYSLPILSCKNKSFMFMSDVKNVQEIVAPKTC